MKVRKLMIMAVLWGVFITEGQAVDNLKFKGKLIVPDCTVNNGNPVETNFGDIEIQTLAAANTGYHWENIRVPVNCPYSLGAPKIRLTGSQAAGA
ncbi:TPA: fimbrial protein, partial [Escherichia coli]|nr:fimbrial protein [Escherichia coli]HDW7542462.1 fimbrial protein [Escherichia coli]